MKRINIFDIADRPGFHNYLIIKPESDQVDAVLNLTEEDYDYVCSISKQEEYGTTTTRFMDDETYALLLRFL